MTCYTKRGTNVPGRIFRQDLGFSARHPGEGRGPVILLDSGFRRNDEQSSRLSLSSALDKIWTRSFQGKQDEPRTGSKLKILVCIKQVPETDAPINLDDASRWITADDSHYLRMNRFDEYAIEEAVLIGESVPETAVDVLTVGPPNAEKILRRAVGMGADNAFHIVCEDRGYLSPFTVASRIAQHATDGGYDLIFTGVISEDNMQGQTGPILAELLSMPCATSVISERLLPDSKRIYVEREIERGRRACVEMTLPAVLTIQSGINRPRYPSLSRMLHAKKMAIVTAFATSLQTPEAREEIVALRYPEKSRQGVRLEGSLQEKAAELVRILGEKSLIR